MGITIYPKRKGKQGQKDMKAFVEGVAHMTEGFIAGYEEGYSDAKADKRSILDKASKSKRASKRRSS